LIKRHQMDETFLALPSIKRFGEILHEHYSSSSPLIFERKKHLSNVEQFFGETRA